MGARCGDSLTVFPSIRYTRIARLKTLIPVLLAGTALLLASGPARAQGFGGRRGGHGGFGPGGLVMMPEVQRELHLDQSQIDQLRQLGVDMREKAMDTFRGIQDLPREERDKRFQSFDAEYRKRINEILDRRQSERLNQLNLQRDGLRGLRRKEVADELKLSQDQRQRVQDAMDSERDLMRDAFKGFQGTMTDGQREALRQKIGEIHAATDARLNAVFTESQRRQWQAMLGPPFKFPEFRRPPPPN